jgi:hypothetical protein
VRRAGTATPSPSTPTPCARSDSSTYLPTHAFTASDSSDYFELA